MKGAWVSYFNGVKSLNAGDNVLIEINPNIPRCEDLKRWHQEGDTSGVIQQQPVT